MTTSVRFSDGFLDTAKIYAEANKRSLYEQIEHWAVIGRMAEDNPDLPYEFIQDTVIALTEVEAGNVTKSNLKFTR